MRFIVGKDIRVEGATYGLKKYCSEKLLVSNPDYVKKLRMGKWLGSTPEMFQLYTKDGSDYILPFGCIEDLYRTYQKTYPFERVFRPLRRVDYKSSINLYPYQEKAVNEALTKRNGVIVMPCGSGKTQTALEIIARIGGRCLWLTHTHELLKQSMDRAKSVYGLESNFYGTITGGKVSIGQGITFATVQTMVRLDLSGLRDSFDIVVVDECHKAIGSPTKAMQFYKVISSLSCRYKFGLTATPKRADGLERMMFALLGNVIYEVSRDAVKETTCPVKVVTYETDYTPDRDIVLAGDGTLNYARLVDDLTNNKERFEDVLSVIPVGSPTLVLANRVEYLHRLNEAYKGRSVCLSGSGTKAAKAQRENALKDLNAGKIDCIFATYQLAKEGLDVPNLRYVVFATPEKDATTVAQSVGRVARKADGKEFGTVIDFVDSFGMFRSWQKKRQAVYKKLECKEV